MKYWDWLDWLMAAFCAFVVGIIVLAVMALVFDAKESAKFQRDAQGMTYQALVMKLGTPTGREVFPDGTEVICWKKYHEATTTMVMSGKVMVPIHNPAHTSGWKAIMRDGVCRRMEEL